MRAELALIGVSLAVAGGSMAGAWPWWLSLGCYPLMGAVVVLARRRVKRETAEREQVSRRLQQLAAESPDDVFTCPLCGRASYHPEDIIFRYCGCCGNELLPRTCEHRVAVR